MISLKNPGFLYVLLTCSMDGRHKSDVFLINLRKEMSSGARGVISIKFDDFLIEEQPKVSLMDLRHKSVFFLIDLRKGNIIFEPFFFS